MLYGPAAVLSDLAHGDADIQDAIIDANGLAPLLSLVRSGSQIGQEHAGRAVWHLAEKRRQPGDHRRERRHPGPRRSDPGRLGGAGASLRRSGAERKEPPSAESREQHAGSD